MSGNRPTKSLRLSEDHQDLIRLLAAFENVGEGDLVEHALEAYLAERVISYRKTLGLSREQVSFSPDTLKERLASVRAAVQEALANGTTARSEEEIKRELRERAEARKGRVRQDAAVTA
jgi:hypothetical protein